MQISTVTRDVSKNRLINNGFYELVTVYQSVCVNYGNHRARMLYTLVREESVSYRLLLDVKSGKHNVILLYFP